MNTHELQLSAETGTPLIEKYELIKRDQVEGTPFTIIETERGCFIGMGQYRLTEFIERDQCSDFILTKDWDFLLSVVSVLVENIVNEKLNVK